MTAPASCFPAGLRENRAALAGSLQRFSILALAAAAAACEGPLPALELESIRPNVAAADRDTTFVIKGSFYAPVGADLGSGRQFLRDDFVAELGGVALSDVTLLSSTELSALMPPGFIEGSHDLLVRDTLGREAVLARAVQVLPPDESAPTVTIDSPEDGSVVMAGRDVEVRFTVTDNLPGVVTMVRMTVSGAMSDMQEIEPESQINPYSRWFYFEARPEAEAVRDIVILVQAWDDAPSRNEGTASINLILDLCDADADCDDGRFCTGREWCDRDDGLCVEGAGVYCNDGIDCTEDLCDDSFRVCWHVPVDTACDNRVFCDGVERCEPEEGCVSGPNPCDDGVGCTVDACEEALWAGEEGTCTSTPSDARCDDGVFCDGPEVCDPDSADAGEDGCVGGVDPCVEDRYECTTIWCDEPSNSCQVEVEDEICDDEDPCTEDLCDKEEGCKNPRTTEGPEGDASCLDGVDNDCDGLFDEADSDC